MKVLATREGLIGKPTASSFIIDRVVPFVALPASRALRRWVLLRNPLNGRTCYAIVLDVGPWNVEDEAYVFGGLRPQAESGTDETGRPTNKAGIDLGEAVWALLGMTDNGRVEWVWAPEIPTTSFG